MERRKGFEPHLVERNKEIVEEYKRVLVLRKVGKKFGMTRERVRQIIEKSGVSVKRTKDEISQLIADYKEYKRTQRLYKICQKCGKGYRQQKNRKKFSDRILCRTCLNKIRAKLDGYKCQKRWMREHPEQKRAIDRRAFKKYYYRHREELIERWRINHRKYYQANRDHLIEYYRQRRIKNLLNKEDLI